MKFNGSFSTYTLLIISLFFTIGCKKEKIIQFPLNFNELEGYWVIDKWQTSSSFSDVSPLTVQFTEINKSGTFQDVPTNSWGYQENEITFRFLSVDAFSIEGQMLFKKEDSTVESWVPVTIFKENTTEVWVNADCTNCANNLLKLRRK